MTTKLFFTSLFLGTLLPATAQTTSFEDIEGFKINLLNGQKEWYVQGSSDPQDIVSIVNSNASDGNNCLKVSTINTKAWTYIWGPVYTDIGSQVTVSLDIFTEFKDHSIIYLAAYDIQDQDPSPVLTSWVRFHSGTGDILIPPDIDIPYDELRGTYSSGVWVNVKVDYDFIANTIKYYVDGTLLFSGMVGKGKQVDQLIFTSMNVDDTENSTAYYIDNIKVVQTNLSVKENELASQFAVYPNPATAVINVANKNAKITAVTLTDLNGRTVKQLSYDNLANVTVNVADLSAGMYLMTIRSSEGSATKKIVKN